MLQMQLFLLNIMSHFHIRYVDQQKYAYWWQHAFNTFLSGWGARVLSISMFILGLYLLVRRENVWAFLVLIFFSFVTAYLGGVMALL